jgi:hypothetical protein
MIKGVVIFLVVMAAIGMIGNAVFPGAVGRSVKSRFFGKKGASTAKLPTCKACGRYVFGSKGCDCRKG